MRSVEVVVQEGQRCESLPWIVERGELHPLEHFLWLICLPLFPGCSGTSERYVDAGAVGQAWSVAHVAHLKVDDHR